MFKSPGSRYVLRGGVVAFLVFLAALKSSIGDGLSTEEYVNLAEVTVASFAAYLGLGAAIPSVEPFVGNQKSDAEVPVPPADPVQP